MTIDTAFSLGDNQVQFTFSATITASIGDWADLLVEGNGPTSVVSGGLASDNFVTLEYVLAEEGSPWEITAEPPSLLFAGGAHLTTPQSGTVIV